MPAGPVGNNTAPDTGYAATPPAVLLAMIGPRPVSSPTGRGAAELCEPGPLHDVTSCQPRPMRPNVSLGLSVYDIASYPCFTIVILRAKT